MSAIKKTAFAFATLATVTAMTVPAHASPPAWVNPFANGLGMGVGAGIGLGITNRLLNPQPNTVVIQQPSYNCGVVYQRDAYGNLIPVRAC